MSGRRKSVEEATFAIASNGFADSPAQALRDYLVARGVRRLTMILHPLVPEDGMRHEILEWRQGQLIRRRQFWFPSRPPLTYPFDTLIPPIAPRADVWFGFNCLACSVGIGARRLGRVERAVYWCIDYVNERFGATPLTRAYEALDGFCCEHADARFELSEVGEEARRQRHARPGRRLAPSTVVPMGAWTDRVPTTTSDGYRARRIVYMGHLVPRQGVRMLVDALSLLVQRGVQLEAEIIGRGPLLNELQEAVKAAGLDRCVTFRGFVAEHSEVERLLAEGSIGLAPYDTDPDNFTRNTDPGKLKAYLAAGLPIVTTDVAPNARKLESEGCADVVDFTPESLAIGIERLLASPALWQQRREASLRVARTFDWNSILDGALASLGFTPGS